MIAFDPLKEMHSEPFELIGSDAGGDQFSRLFEIGSDFGLTKRPHRHARDRNVLEQDLAIVRDRNGAVEFVDTAGKRMELLSCFSLAGRLCEESLSDRKRLIGTDHITAYLEY